MNQSIVMKYFKELSAIPRASFNEKAASDYVVAFAKERNLKYIQDAMNNVIVFKDATPGYENVPTLMLQSHLDMVAEKNKDSDHNFDTDPIELIEKDGWLFANKTTLGADDGVGVVYMLAILDELKHHPALECVFTVEEETGLTGADFIDLSMLESTLCIGLDGSGESETYISSSGGVRGLITKNLTYDKQESASVKIAIRGLLGGHSGGEIDKERGNANKIAGIILRRALKEQDIRLVSIDGGLKVNAIPRESDFEISVSDTASFLTWFEGIEKELKTQFEFSDSGLNFITQVSSVDQVLSKEDSDAIINLLAFLPYGMIQRSFAIEDLVITSANIGTVDIVDGQLKIQVSLRATQSFVIENLMDQVQYLSESLGFSISYSSKYPGWNYDVNSKFRPHLLKVYKELRKSDMDVVATHGGLELGIWKDKLPNLDIVSFGPIMEDIHTPDERLNIASFNSTYEFLKTLVSSLNELN